eukprot:5099478-Lingulodinium_polyedra.AAC.1
MNEEDPEKLGKLFEQYREEYLKREAEKEENDLKRRKLEDMEDEVMKTDDLKRTEELYQEYMQEYKRQKRESNPMQE